MSRSYIACQPGKYSRHPHHEAQVTSKTFLPRKSESEWSLPLISGSIKSGALRDDKPSLWSERNPKYQVRSPSSCAMGCCTRFAKATRLNQVYPERLRTNPSCRTLGTGKQSSSRQTPCGFNSKPVARLRSTVVIQRCPASSLAALISLALSS